MTVLLIRYLPNLAPSLVGLCYSYVICSMYLRDTTGSEAFSWLPCLRLYTFYNNSIIIKFIGNFISGIYLFRDSDENIVNWAQLQVCIQPV